MKRLTRVRALFGFLRQQRHVIFDDAFQDALAAMYRDTGAGDAPHAPAMLCMAMLLQGYVGVSDAEAVECTVMDLRWQMVLDCLGATEPAFSQGALQAFRERLVAHEMDRKLLERTVSLVREGAFTEADRKALSKAVRVAVDSRPLAGAGRVEDTINLLGHAARSIVRIVSKVTDRSEEDICRKAGAPLLLASSIKAGLDIDWSDAKQEAVAAFAELCLRSSSSRAVRSAIRREASFCTRSTARVAVRACAGVSAAAAGVVEAHPELASARKKPKIAHTIVRFVMIRILQPGSSVRGERPWLRLDVDVAGPSRTAHVFELDAVWARKKSALALGGGERDGRACSERHP